MKVLFLINYAGKGGTEKYVRVLAEKLLARGDQCLFAYNESGPLVDEMSALGVETTQVAMAGPMDFKAAKTMAELCGAHNIDIIHTQFARENYIAVHVRRFGGKARVIHTAHINLPNNIIWKLMNRIYMKKNSGIIAVCASVKNHLIQNCYPPEKITVIPNGVVYHETVAGDGGKIRTEFGIDPACFVFVTLTRFTEEKGIFFFLDAIEVLKQRTSRPFQVILAGDGPLLDQARQEAKEKGIEAQVIFAGFRKDGPDLLNAGQVFVNSSSSEASSFAILEAMDGGLPVIATNVGGNPDIVAGEIPCGLIVDYGDCNKMAEAMEKMMLDVSFRECCAKKARIAVRDIFDVNKTFERTYEIYRAALKA